MSDARWQQVSRIYHEALAFPTDGRAAFLRDACGVDDRLRAEVESLLIDNSLAERLLDGKERCLPLIGRRIGVYEISSLLGVGGMGEVYRARDTKLHRDVAIKVLPPAFASEAERLKRFQREARLLASLNHPHIATVHGFEDVDGISALVLELVDGPTLADRLAKGPIPLVEALRVSQQVADALETAHERGIIHRDLKPSNIKVMRDGTVKVLDFGLAKVIRTEDHDLSEATTLRTEEGMIVGTLPYMSPEQVRGNPVDQRADIWAFGCVVYQMLTGQPPFAGETTSDLVAAILTRDPDWSRLPTVTTPGVRRVLRRCLEKDPGRRLRNMGDAALEIAESGEPVADLSGRRHASKAFAALGLASVLVVVALVAFKLGDADDAAPSPREVRFLMDVGPMPTPHSMAISPDDGMIAFAGASPDVKLQGRPMSSSEAVLFIRRLASLQSQPLLGTEGAYSPFFSPAGDLIAFAADGRLKIVNLQSGAVQTVCVIPAGIIEGGTWNRDNVILFSAGGVLYRVTPASGDPTVVIRPNRAKQQQNFRYPQFLPDGRRYVYRVGSLQPTRRAVLIGTLDSEEVTVMVEGESNGAIAPGPFLIFTRQHALLAQRFDPSSLQMLDEPMVLADQILQEANGSAAFTVSARGTLAYRTGGSRSLVWIDRAGRPGAAFGNLSADSEIGLSPDAQRVVFHEPSGNAGDDIYVYEIERGLTTQLTNDPGTDHFGVWSPDGEYIAFDRDERGVYTRRADGATPETKWFPLEEGLHFTVRDWTRDFVLIQKNKPGQVPVEVWAQPTGRGNAFRYLPNLGIGATLSPNGRWVAYMSNEGGRNEVFVQSFPDATLSKRQISSSGGSRPRWRLDGRELYYIDDSRGAIAAVVETEPHFKVAASSRLFTAPTNLYDVTSDGQRFLFNVPSSAVATPTPITVVFNAVGPR